MALTKEEKDIVLNLRASGKTDLEIQRAVANRRAGIDSINTKVEGSKQPSLLSRAVSRTGQIFEEGRKEIAAETAETGQKFEEAGEGFVGTFVEKPALLLQSIFRGAGTVGKTAGKLIAEPVVAGVQKTSDVLSDIPQLQRFASNPFVSSALDTVTEGMTQAGDNYDKFKQENPDLAKNVEAGVEILLTVLGEKATTEILSKTMDATRRAGTAVVEGVSRGVQETGEAISRVVTDITRPVTEKTQPILSRIGTNIRERRAQTQAIRELPTETAQTAARQGIDVNDVRFFTDEIAEGAGDKTLYRELLDSAKAFQEDPRAATNPIEVVGKPIVERLKVLESERGRIGQALGEEAKNLGVVTSEELTPAVLGQLKRVSGLNGITVDSKGVLNFKNTILTTAETAADRKAIQAIYTQAVRWGKGEAKHRLRQELFEILGGKKKSLTNITDTQDKAYQAVRKALSDVLETKNDKYKTLSNEYRKIVQPLSDMRRFMKTLPDAEDDILEMQAGLLARRLTSAASSNPQIRNILRQLDSATTKAGETTVSVEKLQDFYNIISKYYDIDPATGFRGQIKSAIDVAGGGVVDRILKAITGVAGETPAVRQKALEDLLNEVI